MRYSDLTAAILSGDYRNGVPSFNHYTVQVLDVNGQPVPGAEVRVWNVGTSSPYASQLLNDVQTDGAGQAALAWGGTGSPHTGSNMLRLIKTYQDGVAFTPARYVSIFDADIAQLVKGQGSFVVVLQQADQPPSDIMLSNAAIDENQPAGTPIGQLAAVDPDANEAPTFRFCGGADDGSFLLDGSQLAAAAAFDFEKKSSYSLCVQADDGRGGTLDKARPSRSGMCPTRRRPVSARWQRTTDGCWKAEEGPTRAAR